MIEQDTIILNLGQDNCRIIVYIVEDAEYIINHTSVLYPRRAHTNRQAATARTHTTNYMPSESDKSLCQISRLYGYCFTTVYARFVKVKGHIDMWILLSQFPHPLVTQH